MGGRALVLGGGGVTGVAWELGILTGLADNGTDLTAADLVVGTSAGSVVGAQVTTGTPLAMLYEAQLKPPTSEVAARMRLLTMVQLAWAALNPIGGSQAALARVGAMAKRAKTIPQAERKAIIESRLPVDDWPARPRLLITAIAADDGEFVAFDKDSGVSLVDAVAASCAVPGVWPPSDVNGRLFIDGGIRSAANVDLVATQAEAYDRVVVIAPLTAALTRKRSVAGQVGALPPGTRSVVVAPDAAAKAAIGTNVLDPARRADSARAGRDQAGRVAAQVEAVWNP
jgi:NTE family protein